MFNKIKKFTTNCRGFTLTELLVVIAIIGLLAGVTTVSMSGAKRQGRDSKRKADLEIVAGALEIYYAQNREYPADSNWSGLSGTLTREGYINAMPEDPSSQSGFAYEYCGALDNGKKFIIYTKLERKDNADFVVTDHCQDPTTGSGVYQIGQDSFYRVVSP